MKFSALLFSLFALASVPVLAQPSSGPALKKGGGIHHVLNWPVLAADGVRYAWPPFAGPNHSFNEERLRNAARSGMDFERLTVDPGPFLAFDGEQLTELEAVLILRVKEAQAAGLDVLVDFHPISQTDDYEPLKYVGDPGSEFVQRFTALLVRTARLLAEFDQKTVALEILNEPQIGWDPPTTKRWQALAEKWYTAIRQVAPNLTLVITGGQAGDVDGMTALDPRPLFDENVRFTFHYYLPYEFTHQGYQLGLSKFLSGLPYPATIADYQPFYDKVEARIRESGLRLDQQTKLIFDARTKLREYFAKKADPSVIDVDFDGAAAWAKKYGIPTNRIFIGEFGVQRSEFNGADEIHRAAYLRAVREAAEKRGFTWAVWALEFSEMGIVKGRGSPDLLPGIAEALGLRVE